MTDTSAARCCPVVELRQYTLRPGQREVLIELFDRELAEPQEALGIQVIGQFRDLARPDRFVWLRGFTDMDSRRDALTAFYGGPVWAEHKRATNATMVDAGDVLLLRPAAAGTGFPLAERPHPVPAARPAGTLLTATVYALAGGAEDEFVGFLHELVDPVLAEAGRRPVAELRTEPAANTFPALPVRADANVVVRVAGFDGQDGYDRYVQRLQRSRRWVNELRPALDRRVTGPVQRLRLQPTPRSRLR